MPQEPVPLTEEEYARMEVQHHEYESRLSELAEKAVLTDYEQFEENGWALLVDIYAHGLASTEQLFRAACGLTTRHPGVAPRVIDTEALRKRREDRLGARLELS